MPYFGWLILMQIDHPNAFCSITITAKIKVPFNDDGSGLLPWDSQEPALWRACPGSTKNLLVCCWRCKTDRHFRHERKLHKKEEESAGKWFFRFLLMEVWKSLDTTRNVHFSKARFGSGVRYVSVMGVCYCPSGWNLELVSFLTP